MSATGLDVFDRTVQTTNIWLNEIIEDLGPDRQFAWHVLGTVARALRDQLPVDLAAHLGAQLPILVRGTYYDSWRTPAESDKARTAKLFLKRVADGLATARPVATDAAVRAVFGVISRHVDREQVVKVRNALSEPIRRLWPADLLSEASRESQARQRGRQGRIRARAYELWLEDGCPNGYELAHWLRAETEVVTAQMGQFASRPRQTRSRRVEARRRPNAGTPVSSQPSGAPTGA